MRSTTRHHVSEARAERLINDLLGQGFDYAPAPTDVQSVELFKMIGSLTLVEHVYVVTCEQLVELLMDKGLEPDTEIMNERLMEAGFTLAEIEEATEV